MRVRVVKQSLDPASALRPSDAVRAEKEARVDHSRTSDITRRMVSSEFSVPVSAGVYVSLDMCRRPPFALRKWQICPPHVIKKMPRPQLFLKAVPPTFENKPAPLSQCPVLLTPPLLPSSPSLLSFPPLFHSRPGCLLLPAAPGPGGGGGPVCDAALRHRGLPRDGAVDQRRPGAGRGTRPAR